jgi:hypothetical protein
MGGKKKKRKRKRKMVMVMVMVMINSKKNNVACPLSYKPPEVMRK